MKNRIIAFIAILFSVIVVNVDIVKFELVKLSGNRKIIFILFSLLVSISFIMSVYSLSKNWMKFKKINYVDIAICIIAILLGIIFFLW